MKGLPLGPDGEDITWPDQVAPRGRRTSSTRNVKRQTSNLIFPPCSEAGGIPETAGVTWPPCPQVGHFCFRPPLCSGGNPRDGQRNVATLPPSGPLLILPPALKR